MAITTNKLNRYSVTKHEKSAELEQKLVKLEEDIRRLKIEFGIYFNGGTKRPPHESRGRVEASIKRISDDRNLSYAQRYQFNSLVKQYTSYRELWRRQLKTKGEDLM
jgi:hypothetical protein